MNYVVLDLEWNMATNRKYVVREPFVLTGEIIQIGAVKVNEQIEILDTFEAMVKPVFYTKMNRNVHDVTLITDEELKMGRHFVDVIREFREWCGDDYIFLTWGSEDLRKLRDNLEIHNLDVDWLPETYDAQIMFDDQITMEGRSYSLSYAIWKLNIKAMPAHNAFNDAMNTASVLKHLDVMEWIREEREYLASLSYEDEEENVNEAEI